MFKFVSGFFIFFFIVLSHYGNNTPVRVRGGMEFFLFRTRYKKTSSYDPRPIVVVSDGFFFFITIVTFIFF